MTKKKPAFCRFRDLQAAWLNRDLQIHTTATDGEASVQEVIERAQVLGLGEIAFTEHVRSQSTYFPAFAEEVKRLREPVSGLQIYVGVEAKACDADGSLDASPDVLDACEIVLGSVHRFPTRDGALVSVKALLYEDAAQTEFSLSLGLLRHAPIDVLAHPGGMCLRAFGKFPEDHLRTLMEVSLERGIAFEINSSYHGDLEVVTRLCGEVNPVVSIGSDVHRLAELGRCRDMLRAMCLA